MELLTLLAPLTALVLLKACLWCFTGHPDIETFEDTVVLRVRCPEFGVLRKDLSG
jgi:hypothetical protein